MTVSIELLHDQQWRALRRLRLAALADAPQAFWATIDDESRYGAEEWTSFVRAVAWFVASRDGRAVGIVGALHRQEIVDETEVIGMWVEPPERRRGTAAQLLETVRARAHAGGVRCLTLWVIDGNESARRLYESHGFRATGESDALPPGRSGGAHSDGRMHRYVCALSADRPLPPD